jgi:hypothetical protein
VEHLVGAVFYSYKILHDGNEFYRLGLRVWRPEIRKRGGVRLPEAGGTHASDRRVRGESFML